jgi:hypothetical protein
MADEAPKKPTPAELKVANYQRELAELKEELDAVKALLASPGYAYIKVRQDELARELGVTALDSNDDTKATQARHQRLGVITAREAATQRLKWLEGRAQFLQGQLN